jgi:hypothetical protein
MHAKLVMCPETDQLESIEYEVHPLGVLIASCSRYTPACDVQCPRTCAIQMDLETRLAARQTKRG